MSPADWQGDFAAALRDPDRRIPGALLPARAAPGRAAPRGFDVYRNNRASSLIGALAGTYPAVARLAGEPFFRAAARLYIDADPPRSPVLHRYGAGFADFIDAFEPAGSVPYLGDVARLEWACLQAYHAADASPLPIEALGSFSPRATPSLRLALHPSLRLIRSRWPVASLRAAVLGAGVGTQVEMERPEDAIVVRPRLELDVRVLPAGSHAFVRALHRGDDMARAAGRALAENECFDLATELRALFDLGAVVAIHQPEEE